MVEQDRREGDQLAAENEAIHVQRGLPPDLIPANHIRPDRPRHQSEPAAAVALLGALHLTAAPAALHGGGWDHGDAVSLIGVPINASRADGLARRVDRLLERHADLLFGV